MRYRFRYICFILATVIFTGFAAGCGKPGSSGQKEPERPSGLITEELTVMDIYGNGYNNNCIVGFDEYGRTVTSAAKELDKREVGIFYFAWLGDPKGKAIYDVSKILDRYGKDVLFHEEDDKISPNGQPHWWAEPLYGYYCSSDKWVIRKHLEMLTESGVDFLIFDTTNCVLYESTILKIMKTICEIRAEGWEAPQVVFYTHSRSIETIGRIFTTFYRDKAYEDSWYKVDGKPMIIGYTSAKKDIAEAKSRGETTYKPSDLSQTLQDFFFVKEACWPNDIHNDNSFPYTEWCYPQPLNGNTMNVSVATHPMVPFSFSLTHENWGNWGRGYDVNTGENKHEDIYKGTFFQSEWETVFEKEPEMIMITGWNEWIAWKQPYGGEYMLCDNVDMEYSRDIEPMKGGYEDAYFIQMIANIRKYKYQSQDGLIPDNVYKTVDINGDDSQWDDVLAIYRHVGTDNTERKASGASNDGLKYETPAADNNLLNIKVTNDAEYLYVRAESDSRIVTSNKANWMNLFIGKGVPTQTGWESYSYVINRSRSNGKMSVDALDSGFKTTNLGEAEYAVSANHIYFKIPLSLLGLTGETAKYGQIYFKLADGIADDKEIMSYYESGRSMPMGRLSYEYKFAF